MELWFSGLNGDTNSNLSKLQFQFHTPKTLDLELSRITKVNSCPISTTKHTKGTMFKASLNVINTMKYSKRPNKPSLPIKSLIESTTLRPHLTKHKSRLRENFFKWVQNSPSQKRAHNEREGGTIMNDIQMKKIH